jgi:hypothetical protein
MGSFVHLLAENLAKVSILRDLFFPRDIVLLKLLMRPSPAGLTAKVNIEAETASSIPRS